MVNRVVGTDTNGIDRIVVRTGKGPRTDISPVLGLTGVSGPNSFNLRNCSRFHLCGMRRYTPLFYVVGLYRQIRA